MSRDHIKEAKHKLRTISYPIEQTAVHPTILFHFIVGDLMLKQSRLFLKLDAKTIGLFVVKKVKGIYRQWIFIKPVNNPEGYR